MSARNPYLPLPTSESDTEMSEERGDFGGSPRRHGIIKDRHVDDNSGAVIHDKSKAERWFVLRLDLILLVYCCVSQIMKGLDQQNISAAYVSGLREDLDVKGNEYNYFTTFFNIGYAIFVIPSQIMMTRFRPSRWLPFLEFSWGILTIGLYRVNHVWQIFALRAFIGAFEASGYGGAVVLLMSWYTPRELAFRIAFYHSSQWVGSMFAGALQAAIYTTLDDVHGLEGWRWMFLIDGIMTLGVAAMGLFFLPDYPNNPNPLAKFWLKSKHLEIARLRTLQFRRADNKKFTIAAVRRAFKQPQVVLFPVLYVTCQLAQQGYLFFNLWLKALRNPDGSARWSVAQVNSLPIAGYAISIVCVWGWGSLSDYLQTRRFIILAQAVLGCISGIIMSVWDVPIGAKYFAYFLSFTFIATTPAVFAWLSDMTPHDAEQRSFIVGLSIACWYGINSWANVLIWPASKAPHYPAAWQVTIGLWIWASIWLFVIRFVEVRYVRPRNQEIAATEYEAAIQQAADDQKASNAKVLPGPIETAVLPVNARDRD